MPIPDLWPGDISEKTDILMPVTILREQAAALTQRTKGLLEGNVRSENPKYPGDDFVHRFELVAPALDNYRYELFFVAHDLTGYPARVCFDGKEPKAETQEAFVNLLRIVFNQGKTKGAIQSLLAQSTS